MANTKQEAVDTIMGRLQKSNTGRGILAVRAPDPGAVEKSPGRFTVHLDAYGEDNAMRIFDRFNGKEVASGTYKRKERVKVVVYGYGKLAHCRHCDELGHMADVCTAETMYLQSASNGLPPEFCAYIRPELGASATFAGTDPLAKGDKPFGFAVFRGGISPTALGGAIALYTAGLLSHLPRITRAGGVHACRDCGQLDEDADLGGRPGNHENADSPLCALHRRDNLSGRRRRPRGPAPIRATPHWVVPAPRSGSLASGPHASTQAGQRPTSAAPLQDNRSHGSPLRLSGDNAVAERTAAPEMHLMDTGPTSVADGHTPQTPQPLPVAPSAAVYGVMPPQSPRKKTPSKKAPLAGHFAQ